MDPTSTPHSVSFSRPQQTSTFLVLAQELQDNIVSQARREDLSSLSMTCLSLRKTTVPFLFSAITLVDGEARKHWKDRKNEAPRVAKFLRTINEAPHLAALIRTLRLKETGCKAEAPARIIASTTNLTSLEFEYLLNQYHATDRVYGARLASTLSQTKSTLTYLRISYKLTWEAGEFGQPITDSSYCSLKSLGALKTVDITPWILLGWYPQRAPPLEDVLPSSLVSWHLGEDAWWFDGIDWDKDSMMEIFLAFLRHGKWKEVTPKLKEFGIHVGCEDELSRYSDPEEGNAEDGKLRREDEFRHLCEENGLVWNGANSNQ